MWKKKQKTKKRWKIQSHLLMSPSDILIIFFFWVFLWTRNRTQDWEETQLNFSCNFRGRDTGKMLVFLWTQRWFGWRVWRKKGTGVVCVAQGSELSAELEKDTGDNAELDIAGLKAWSTVRMRLCGMVAVALERGEDTHRYMYCRTTWHWVIRRPG